MGEVLHQSYANLIFLLFFLKFIEIVFTSAGLWGLDRALVRRVALLNYRVRRPTIEGVTRKIVAIERDGDIDR